MVRVRGGARVREARTQRDHRQTHTRAEAELSEQHITRHKSIETSTTALLLHRGMANRNTFSSIIDEEIAKELRTSSSDHSCDDDEVSNSATKSSRASVLVYDDETKKTRKLSSANLSSTEVGSPATAQLYGGIQSNVVIIAQSGKDF